MRVDMYLFASSTTENTIQKYTKYYRHTETKGIINLL